MVKGIKIEKVLEKLDFKKFTGDESEIITNILSISDSGLQEGTISWCNKKNIETLKEKKKGTYIVSEDAKVEELSDKCNFIVVSNPREAFRVVLESFFYEKDSFEGLIISPSAQVQASLNKAHNIRIGHNVVIEKDCRIGNNVIVEPNTIIKKGTVIKDNVIIGSNCTIGGAGFGYEQDGEGNFVFMPHIGNVIIDEGAEIGNNSCIDRAVLGSTVVGRNVKIDNLVHIAHGVKIGENSLIIANSMIAGSCVLGKNVWISPSSSILNGKVIGDNSIVGMGAVVLKDVDSGQTVVGNPSRVLGNNQDPD